MLENFLPHFLATGALSGFFAGLLGIGGGSVISPLLLEVFHSSGAVRANLVAHLAIGTSLATVACTAISSATTHARGGRVVFRLAGILGAGTVCGAAIGGAAVSVLPGGALKLILAVFLLYNALAILRRKKTGAAIKELPGTAGILAAGAIIGFLSALTGTGGGIFIVPYLVSRNIEIKRAIGTSAVTGFPTAVAAAGGYVAAGWGEDVYVAGAQPILDSWGYVIPEAVAMLAAGSILFAAIGARLTRIAPEKILRRVFALMLVVFAARIIYVSALGG